MSRPKGIPSIFKGKDFVEKVYVNCQYCNDQIKCYPSNIRKFCNVDCDNRYRIGKKRPSHSIKMKEIHKNKEFGYKKGEHIGENNYFYGKTHTDEFKKEQRERAQIRMIKNQQFPNIGKNEKQLLDEFEKSNNLKLKRQYPIKGYFVDGYCKKLNLVVEIDEKPKINERDIRREKEIVNKLNCNVIRIIDYG